MRDTHYIHKFLNFAYTLCLYFPHFEGDQRAEVFTLSKYWRLQLQDSDALDHTFAQAPPLFV
jgi:hypothetical protein